MSVAVVIEAGKNRVELSRSLSSAARSRLQRPFRFPLLWGQIHRRFDRHDDPSAKDETL